MKYAICNETFQGWNWQSTCSAIAAESYDGVEVAPFTLAADARGLTAGERAELRRAATTAGLEIVGLHWLLVSPKGLSLTARGDDLRETTAEYLASLVDLCADLGGRVMVLGSPGQRRIPDGDSAATALGRLEAALAPALSRAERSGITICLEPLPAPEADLLLTLGEAAEAVRRIGSPALRTIFDVKSASSENRPLDRLFAEYAGIVAHIHANDANRRGPGFGSTDFLPLFRAMRQCNYAGWVSVEVFDYAPDPVTIARESLAYLRRCEKEA